MDYETRRALQQQQATISELAKQMGVEASKRQQALAEANQRKAVDVMTEVQGKLIDRSAAYTNLMLIGGYAGFFALWSGTRSNLPIKANVAIAGLATLSLAIFISFEVYKMVVTALRFLKNRHFLHESLSPDQFVKRLEELKREEAKLPVGYMGIWVGAVGAALLFAFLAFALLTYNFFAILVGFSTWPT